MDDDIFPDLGLSYLEAGRGAATFTFGRLSCSMMARIGPNAYTTMSTITMEVPYALSVDFDGTAFASLLKAVRPDAAKELQRLFGGAFRGTVQLDLPEGEVVTGVRARLGDPQANDDETYVPFVALEFRPPEMLASISVTD